MNSAIRTPSEMQQALAQLGRMYAALADLRAKVEPVNPRNFGLLAEGHLAQIRQLQQELDDYAGVVAAESATALWVRVVGQEIEWPLAPTSVMTAILDALRKGVQSIAELALTGELSSRPTAELKASADFRVAAFAPGSFRVAVQLPEQSDSVGEAVRTALDDYLRAAAWAGSESSEDELRRHFPDERRRRLIPTELARVAPRERGQVESVEFSGGLLRRLQVAGPVALSRPTRKRINDALDASPEHRVEQYTGTLREIDLDRRSFLLRNAGGEAGEVRQVACDFPEELLEAAKEALDKRVRVTGSRPVSERRREPSLQVSRIEIIEGE